MAKNDKLTIPLGSGDVYGATVPSSLPSTNAAWVELITTVCVSANMLGKVKNGATIEYNATTYIEKCDDKTVMKIIVTDEEASLKVGMITWNSEVLHKLIDRSDVATVTTGTGSTAKNYRVAKIGGKGNEQDQDYVVIFHHIDAKAGDTWTILVGRNTAPISLAFSNEAGSLIEPTFTATPLDSDGTLIVYVEELDDGASST